ADVAHGNGKASGAGGAGGKAHKNADDAVLADTDAKDNGKGLDAKLGALHAVHANLQAFIHASPNSRVGKLAAYAKALVGLEGDAAVVAAAQALLDGANATLTTKLGDQTSAITTLLGFKDPAISTTNL